MGAFWHIGLPVEIRFEDTPDMTKRVESIYSKDFAFDHLAEYQVQSPPLPNGTHLTFHRREKIYRLETTVWTSEWLDFYVAFIKAFQVYSREKNYPIYSVANDQRLVQSWLDQIRTIEVRSDPKQYATELKTREHNYFVHFYDLPEMVVYHGYPLPHRNSTSIKILSILTSHEKMEVLPEETVMFYQSVEQLKRHLSSSYRLANYLLLLGFLPRCVPRLPPPFLAPSPSGIIGIKSTDRSECLRVNAKSPMLAKSQKLLTLLTIAL